MNEKVLKHKEICDGLNELYARKNHDYGDSFHTTFVEEACDTIKSSYPLHYGRITWQQVFLS